VARRIFTANIAQLQQAVNERLAQSAALQNEQTGQQLRSFAQTLHALTESNERRLVDIRTTLEGKLKELQTDNAAKLDEMRKTVDERLHATLEQRLGESFKLVSDRLEQVHRGLGEMQNLASGVGDLKRVLTNVKTRGTWGEIQLGALLEQVLAPDQYGRNVATRPGSRERVEFAVKLPGRDAGLSANASQPVWLPVDAKFPTEDYERLLAAQDAADAQLVEEASRALENRIRLEAKQLSEKYVEPPHTTDFAILFVPTEGLYAELLRRPGLADALQREYKVSIAGPTTLHALLNSLQMGFRTLAIEKRSAEVWAVLGAVKTEFAKFGEVLAKTKQQLQTVANSIDQAETRTRSMERKLRQVEQLPDESAQELLGEGGAAK
jgi:DNA recombination protein RmuC